MLDELSQLQRFDLHRAIEAFETELDRIRADGGNGSVQSLANVAKLAGDEAAAGLVLRVSEAIAVADGMVSDRGRATIGDIATALATPPPDLPEAEASRKEDGARVIVIGNEKGGTGKSTSAIHIATGLAQQGLTVACLDLDGRQATLSRFMKNRLVTVQREKRRLVIPRCRRIEPSVAERRTEADLEEQASFVEAMDDFHACDAIVVDTPGYSSYLAKLAHARADVVVTPINDSFVDIDALADIDRERHQVHAPSGYCRMVLQQRERRGPGTAEALDWIVTRNRVGQLDTRNTREMTSLLSALSHRMGFRVQPGFSERVVFRELFFKGLTLFDLAEESVPSGARVRLLRARSEVETFLAAITAAADRSTKVQKG